MAMDYTHIDTEDMMTIVTENNDDRGDVDGEYNYRYWSFGERESLFAGDSQNQV